MVRTLMGHVNRPVNASTGLLASGSIRDGYTVSRTGSATVIDQYGNVVDVAANTPRYTYGDYVGVNLVRNPRMVGTVVGGQPNVATYIGHSPAAGMNATVVGYGRLPDGTWYQDIRVVGPNTAATTLYFQWYPEGQQYIFARQNDVITVSAYIQVLDGKIPFSGGGSLSPGLVERTGSTVSNYSFSSTGMVGSLSTTMQRVYRAITVANAATDNVQPGFWFNCQTSDAYIDITVRIAGPQVEYGSVPTELAYPPSGVLGPSRKYTGKRLLVEDSRTNSIRNPRAEGLTAGTPGVTPTHWGGIVINGGLTRTIVGNGYEFGLPYVEVRVQGNIGTTSQHGIFPEIASTGSLTTAQGTIVSTSFYLRLVAGSTTGVTNWYHNLIEQDGAFAQIGASTPTIPAPTAVLTRHSRSHTIATVGTVSSRGAILLWDTAANTDIDFTIRYYAPQYELGMGPSSLILPPVGAPAVTTRSFDDVRVPLTQFAKFGTPVTNRLLQSNTFSDAAWTKASSSVLANAATAPAGSTDAWRLTLNNTNAGLIQSADFPDNTIVTFSFYAKAETVTSIGLQFYDRTPAYRGFTVDLTTGQYSGTFGTGMWWNVQFVGNGWYRIVGIGSVNAGASTPSFRIVGNGTGTETLLVYEAQAEVTPIALPTNLMSSTRPENLNSWNHFATSAIPHATAAPDGYYAQKLEADGTLAQHRIEAGSTLIAGTYGTLTFYAKAAEQIHINARFMSAATSGNRLQSNFNLSTGLTENVLNVGTGAGARAKMTDAGNGWYRCELAGIPAVGDAGTCNIGLFLNAGGGAFTGPGGAYIWGVTVTPGDAVPDYVPLSRLVSQPVYTTTTTLTRSKLAPGTIIVKYKVPVPTPGNPQGVVSFITPSGATGLRAGIRYGGTTTLTLFNFNGFNGLATNIANTPQGSITSAALAWDDWITLGVAKGVITPLYYPPHLEVTHLLIGGSAVGGQGLYGEIESVTYYPYKMTDAQLLAATA